jgi:hypothetical protein
METVGMPGVAELGLIVIVLSLSAIGALLTVIPFWKICSKAGFPGALSLLMLVPIANIVLPFYVAFAQWPALTNQNQ